MRSDGEVQFAPVEMPEAEPAPDWLINFLDWVGEAFSPVAQTLVWAWPLLFWVLVAAAVALLILLIVRIIDPATLRRRRNKVEEADWTPEEEQALALLEEADRLAEEGRFDEATHLLLQRSVRQIADIRPDLVDPSSTAREIAALPALPDNARGAFSAIAERVERSLFALRQLSREDWQAARTAYSEFALGYEQVRG